MAKPANPRKPHKTEGKRHVEAQTHTHTTVTESNGSTHTHTRRQTVLSCGGAARPKGAEPNMNEKNVGRPIGTRQPAHREDSEKKKQIVPKFK